MARRGGGLCVLFLALGFGVPGTTWAQTGEEDGADEAAEATNVEMDFSVGDPETAGESPPEGGDAESGDDLLGAIGGLGPDQPPEIESADATPQLEEPERWSRPRIYALRSRRFEIVPRFSFSMNDQFVSHTGFGGNLNWYITEVLSIGVEGIWFFGNRETDINYYTSRSFRVSIPINEYWMGWYLNFSYVPIYGKFAIFNRWIWHWDTFITGGLGVTLTRPIAVVDAEFRDFSDTADYNPNITFNIGIGGRLFLTRFMAIFFEIRLYGFPQPLESREVAPLDDPDCTSSEACGESWPYQRANPETWLDEDGEFAVNVMAQIGLSIFLPMTFTYRLPL